MLAFRIRLATGGTSSQIWGSQFDGMPVQPVHRMAQMKAHRARPYCASSVPSKPPVRDHLGCAGIRSVTPRQFTTLPDPAASRERDAAPRRRAAKLPSRPWKIGHLFRIVKIPEVPQPDPEEGHRVGSAWLLVPAGYRGPQSRRPSSSSVRPRKTAVPWPLLESSSIVWCREGHDEVQGRFRAGITCVVSSPRTGRASVQPVSSAIQRPASGCARWPGRQPPSRTS